MPTEEEPTAFLSPPSLVEADDCPDDLLNLCPSIEDAESMNSFMDSITAIAEVPHLPSELESVAEDVLIPPRTSAMSVVQRAVYEQRKAQAAAGGKPLPPQTGAPSSPPHEPTGLRRMATSPANNKRARGGSPDGEDVARHAPMPKADGKVRFFCKHPQCGKGYASTDAVRKHCRQRHLEWLRRLGQGCPTLYCEWVDGDAPEGYKPSTF